MKICDASDHGEIVHDEKYCPACERIDRTDNDLREAKKEIADLTDQLDEALNREAK